MEYKFSVYAIFDKDYNYLKTVASKEVKDKVLKSEKNAKYFTKLDVLGQSRKNDAVRAHISSKISFQVLSILELIEWLIQAHKQY